MWILFAISASLFWGLTYVFNEQIYKKISIFSSLGITFFIVSIITLIFAFASGNLKTDITTLISSKRLLWYFVGGVTSLLIAEIFIGFSIVAKSATLAGLIEISYPVFIVLFSYLLFKETINISTFIGGAVVFIGIFIIYYFNK